MEVVKLVTPQFRYRISVAVLQHQLIDIVVDLLIGNGHNAHALNGDGSALRAGAGNDGSEGILVRLFLVDYEHVGSGQLCKEGFACSPRQVKFVGRLRSASESVPLNDAAVGVVLFHHRHMDFHRKGIVRVGKGNVDSAARARSSVGVLFGRIGIDCAAHINRSSEGNICCLRNPGGLRSDRGGGRYFTASASIILAFRLAGGFAVEQDRRIGLAVFESVGLIPFRGRVKYSRRLADSSCHIRFAIIDPAAIDQLLLLYRYNCRSSLRHKQMKGKLRIQDSAGTHRLLVKHDHRRLLGIIDHIELGRVTAARPSRVLADLCRVLEAAPGVPDSQNRGGFIRTNGIRDQAQVGGVHLCLAVRIGVADCKGVVRESGGRKLQRRSKLVRHAVFAKKRVRLCASVVRRCHILKHAVRAHALVADVQRLLLAIDEVKLAVLAKVRERRRAIVLYLYLLVLIFDRDDRVALGNRGNAVRDRGKGEFVVFGRRRHMARAVQRRLRGGHLDVRDRPPGFIGFIRQISRRRVHSMDGYGVRLTPEGVQIQRTRHRLRKVIFCIGIRIRFAPCSGSLRPVAEQAFVRSRVNRNLFWLGNHSPDIRGLGIHIASSRIDR